MSRQPRNVSAAKQLFAILFRTALKDNPTRPSTGWSQRQLANRIKKTPATISNWYNGKVLPEDAGILEKAIAVLYGNGPGWEEKKEQLRGAWRIANRAMDQSAEEVHRSSLKVRGFLIPRQCDRRLDWWRLENVANLIAHGQFTYDVTDRVISAVKRASPLERSRITEALVNILVEPSSSDADLSIKEVAAAILSKLYAWRPTDKQLSNLRHMCDGEFASSSSSLSAVYGVALGLARAGNQEIMERAISAYVLDEDRGIADYCRLTAYYGNEFLQFDGVMSHFSNRKRVGSARLILASDTNCLLRLIDSQTLPPDRKREIKPKLLLSAKLLFGAGLEKEARKAATKANLIR